MAQSVYRRIAVPLDGTPESRHAIAVAAGIARLADCELELVHVAFTAGYNTELYGAAIPTVEDVALLRRDAERALREAAADAEKLGVRVVPTLLDGDVKMALTDHLAGGAADLIVMTTHDRGRLERLFLGSVSHSVVRHVHIPVLIVRTTDGEQVPLAASSIAHILVPLDGSAFSEQVLPHAVKLARVLECRLSLLAVLQPLFAAAALSGIAGGPNLTMPAAIAESDSHAAQSEIESRALEQAADPLRASGLNVETRVVVDANAGRAIVEDATRHEVDLIAMTTHGRGALRRIVAGSVSESVLRMSHMPMLMYRPERLEGG